MYITEDLEELIYELAHNRVESDYDIIEEDFNLYCLDCYDHQIEADIINNQIQENK